MSVEREPGYFGTQGEPTAAGDRQQTFILETERISERWSYPQRQEYHPNRNTYLHVFLLRFGLGGKSLQPVKPVKIGSPTYVRRDQPSHCVSQTRYHLSIPLLIENKDFSDTSRYGTKVTLPQKSATNW